MQDNTNQVGNQAGWNFDPQTGQPVLGGQNPPDAVPQQPSQSSKQFCAQTGQPLQQAQASAPAQPVKQFCGQTGQPLDGSPRVVDTGRDSGQDKCPKCGATDISFNPQSGQLRCNFCRTEFQPQKVAGFEQDVSRLHGKIIGSGTKDIAASAESMITLKCQSCGAEVVIDTDETAQARCHWCRNTLSINEQVPNGAIPDAVLPFVVQKEIARAEIEKFVSKRKFFAHPSFRKEFCTENVMGVYLPYMIVDVNAHSYLKGQGEVLVRKYTVGSGNNQQTRYDADLYDVERDYDIVMKGLTIESNTEKLYHGSSNRTNNIINAIMPFDTENCVAWNANYLKGYASEKRDANVDDLKGLVEIKAKDISRHQANTTLSAYNRGVKWSQEQLSIKGQQWKAAYLPVWLYSYQQVKSANNKVLHYVAVNARSKETMGSVPIHQPKLLFFSLLMSIIGSILAFFLWPVLDTEWVWVLAGAGFLYYGYYYNKYRNAGARHLHEVETKAGMSNVRRVDKLLKRRTGLSNATMDGANNFNVDYGSGGKGNLLAAATKEFIDS
ncbi:MAG: TFIIB-type zinc ribbon-containing protein [Coriobacteriia bacterium]|nr:TFIIB-type zinc ribbon-containing protein [Coriobacteriia bacterium]